MSGYFKPGMTEAEQRAIGAKLDPTLRAKLLADALALLPSCESPELYNAVENLTPSSSYTAEQIQTLSDGWTGDYDKMQAAYDRLKPCTSVSSRPSLWAAGLLAFAAIVAVGVAVEVARS